ncbi:conserved Plasmodium protein, unknown function [Plasmodium sp. DRC-Itaito]|nr:conserved Plasmodium protein, unknown function [Plasmodium sp. DRC-Itaito]
MENIEKEENYLDRLTNLFKYLTLGVEKNKSTEKNSTHSIKYDDHKNSLQQVVYNLKLKRASELNIPHRFLGNADISKNDFDKERDNNTKREDNEYTRDNQIYDYNKCEQINDQQNIPKIYSQQEDDKKVYFYSSSIDLEHGEMYKIDQTYKQKKKKKKKKKEKEKHKGEYKDERNDEYKDIHNDEYKDIHNDEYKDIHNDEYKDIHNDEYKDIHNDEYKYIHNDEYKDIHNDEYKDIHNDKHIKEEKQTNIEKKKKKHKKKEKEKRKNKQYELEQQNYSINKIKLVDTEKENILMTNLKSVSSSNNSEDIKDKTKKEQNIINNNLYTLDKNKTYISIRSNKEKNRVIKLPKLNITNNLESSSND